MEGDRRYDYPPEQRLQELREKLQITAFDGCYQMLSDCLLFMEFIVKLFYNLFDVSVD